MRLPLCIALIIACMSLSLGYGDDCPDCQPSGGRTGGGLCHSCGARCGRGAALCKHHCHPGCCHLCNKAAYRASLTPWHGGFYDPTYGAPIALVVPPTAEMQTNWGWGVGNTRVAPIYHQFGPNYPGAAPAGVGGYGYGFLPTPPWPSDTMQFGVYSVRGPW